MTTYYTPFTYEPMDYHVDDCVECNACGTRYDYTNNSDELNKCGDCYQSECDCIEDDIYDNKQLFNKVMVQLLSN